MAAPKKNIEFIFNITLFDAASRPNIKANPTLAAGDVTVHTDGVDKGNIDTLPTVTPASGESVKVTLSADEMNGDYISIVFIDQTDPKEWDDVFISIETDETALGIILGACGSTSLSNTTCSSNLTNANDQLIGRLITFLDGNAKDESSDITGFASTNGVLTFTALTTAPANTDRFKIT